MVYDIVGEKSAGQRVVELHGVSEEYFCVDFFVDSHDDETGVKHIELLHGEFQALHLIIGAFDFQVEYVFVLALAGALSVDDDLIGIPSVLLLKPLKSLDCHSAHAQMGLQDVRLHIAFSVVFREVSIEGAQQGRHEALLLARYLLVHVDAHYHRRLVAERHVAHRPRHSSHLRAHLNENLVHDAPHPFRPG